MKDCEQRSYRKPSSLHRRLSFKSSRSSLLLLRVAFKHFNSLFLQWETNLWLEIKSEKQKTAQDVVIEIGAAKNRTQKTGLSRCWPFKEVSLQRVGEPRFLIRLWWVLATRARAKLFRPKMVDYYSVLDVTKAATTPEIKKA